MSVLHIPLLAILVQISATASVEGVVVKAGTNDSISDVALELTAQATSDLPAQTGVPARPYSAVTGVDGKFVFRNVAAGTYRLIAERVGGSYLPVEYGQRGSFGRGVAFPIAAAEQKKDVRLEMMPPSSITGRITDVDNSPVGHAAVMAFAPTYRRGKQVLTMMELVHSDDHGEYRLFSLTPGRYYVAVRMEDPSRRSVALSYAPPGRILTTERIEPPVVIKRVLPNGDRIEETYQEVYYGSGANPAGSTPVNLLPATIVSGIDISIAEAKVPSLHIRGKLTASNPEVLVGARVIAVPQQFAPDMIAPSGSTDANGVFDLAGAVPGKYFLTAQVTPNPNTRAAPPAPPQLGLLPIEVTGTDLEGIAIAVTPGNFLAGKIVMENRLDTDPDLANIRVDLSRDPDLLILPHANLNSTFSPNGEFSMATVPGGSFIVQVSGVPSNAYTKSIQLGSTDLLENLLLVDGKVNGQLVVTVGTDASTLTGRVVDDRQGNAVNVKVALVPDAPLRRRWDLYRSTATDQSGAFAIQNVPPGDYRVFAWADAVDNAWQDAEFLRADEGRGTPIHIRPSRVEDVEVTVIPVR